MAGDIRYTGRRGGRLNREAERQGKSGRQTWQGREIYGSQARKARNGGRQGGRQWKGKVLQAGRDAAYRARQRGHGRHSRHGKAGWEQHRKDMHGKGGTQGRRAKQLGRQGRQVCKKRGECKRAWHSGRASAVCRTQAGI